MPTYNHSGIQENRDFFLSKNSSIYYTVLDDFQSDHIHYVDTEYYASSILIPLLTFRLNFVLTSINHKSVIHTHVMTYFKYSKEILSFIILTPFKLVEKFPNSLYLTQNPRD
jgi:hypothetical protein